VGGSHKSIVPEYSSYNNELYKSFKNIRTPLLKLVVPLKEEIVMLSG
jgi:hypothetical protein